MVSDTSTVGFVVFTFRNGQFLQRNLLKDVANAEKSPKNPDQRLGVLVHTNDVKRLHRRFAHAQ